MKTNGNALTLTTLNECESVIENAAHQVGAALQTIRAMRLWDTGEYDTFEHYCKARWGYTSKRANQLITHADKVRRIETDTNGIQIPDNERQTRPLGKLPPAEQADAWAEAVEESGGQPTQAKVEEVVAKRKHEQVHEQQAPTVAKFEAHAALKELLKSNGRVIRAADKAGQGPYHTQIHVLCNQIIETTKQWEKSL